MRPREPFRIEKNVPMPADAEPVPAPRGNTREDEVKAHVARYFHGLGADTIVVQAVDYDEEKRLSDLMSDLLERTTISKNSRLRGDVIAKWSGGEKRIVEAKGLPTGEQQRAKYFQVGLAQLLQNMTDDRARFSLALPEVDSYRRAARSGKGPNGHSLPIRGSGHGRRARITPCRLRKSDQDTGDAALASDDGPDLLDRRQAGRGAQALPSKKERKTGSGRRG